jgi:hypothetical protein
MSILTGGIRFESDLNHQKDYQNKKNGPRY